MGIDGLTGLVAMLLFPALGLLVLYAIIRWAVRDGMSDALREQEAARVRSELQVGEERSPNSRPD
jgi:hypothetical protein